MTSGKQPGYAAEAAHPAVQASAGQLHHRRGWIWTLVASLAGFIIAVVIAAKPATGGTASFLLDLVGLVMLIVFVVALVMVLVITARLRQHAPEVRGPALAVHRATPRPALAHPHDRHRHPVGYVFWVILLAGWLVGAVVFAPRLVDSIAYLAGAGANATFIPGSYVTECSGRAGCSTATNGVMNIDGHPTPVTWPAQVPLNVSFTVREPVWRWALGSGLIDGDPTAVGSLIVGLLFEAGAGLAIFLIIRPGIKWLQRRRHPPAAGSAALVRNQPRRHQRGR
jgi:hypothetical protein